MVNQPFRYLYKTVADNWTRQTPLVIGTNIYLLSFCTIRFTIRVFH